MNLTRRLHFSAVWLVAIALSSVLLSSPALPDPPRSSPTQIRATIQRARTAWVEGDAKAFADLFTASGELIVPGQRWQGQAAIEAETARFVQQFKVAIEIQTIVVEGNQAAVAWAWTETPKTLGEPHQTEDVILIEFEAGQIRRWREYIDAATPAIGKSNARSVINLTMLEDHKTQCASQRRVSHGVFS